MYFPDRRKTARKALNRHGNITVSGGKEQSFDCCVNDISIRGIRVQAKRKLPRDKVLKFKLKTFLNKELESDIIETWIIWQKIISDISVYGIHFTKIKEADRSAIENFICHDFSHQGGEPERNVFLPQSGTAKKEDELFTWGELKGGGGMQEAEFEDKRIFERLPVRLSVKFLDVGSNKEGLGVTHDVSAKGVGITTEQDLSPRTPVEMWLRVPDKSDFLYTRGEVIWSRMMPDQRFRVGVNLEKADLMGISRILRIGG